ncbi:hypothetical protein [Mastigocoleus testarum]|uniref:hypothetical protein n=1 Tax=Mastigocoleus testarum TaxID=996925 RepID=UPI001F24B828|nr:hypothetical protein [Mastigocoleus testarum]
MLAQFQSLYPEGSIISELIQIHHDKYIVRVNVQVQGVTRITGMAAAETIEVAEDRARERALMVLKQTNPQNNSTNPAIQAQEAQGHSPHFNTKEINTQEVAVKAQLDLDRQKISQATESQTATGAIKHNQPPVPEKPMVKEVTPAKQFEPSPRELTKAQADEVLSARDEDKFTAAKSTYSYQGSSYQGSGLTANIDAPPQEINQPSLDSGSINVDSQLKFDSPLPENGVSTPDESVVQNQLPLMSSTNVQSFMSPEYSVEEERKVTASVEKKSSSTTRKKKKTEPKDSTQPKSLLDPIAEIDVEMRRLGWTREQGREHLIQTYNKRARSLLTDEQLLEFLEYLKSQPTPADPLDPGF